MIPLVIAWLGGACLLEIVAILTFKFFLQKSFYIKNGITIFIISASNALYFSLIYIYI